LVWRLASCACMAVSSVWRSTSPRLVILGDPGCGKTTFLRWVAHCLAADRLGRDPGGAARYLGLVRVRLPILVPMADWIDYIEHTGSKKNGPTLPDSAEWLPAYLGARASVNRQRLDADDFRRLLDAGEALILLDGLDEVPDRRQRERAVRRIERLALAWPDCPLVVTSRPVAYRDRTVPAGFAHTTIEALDAAAIDGFLARWSRALFPERPERGRCPPPRIGRRACLRPRDPILGPQHRHAHRTSRRALERQTLSRAARRALRICAFGI